MTLKLKYIVLTQVPNYYSGVRLESHNRETRISTCRDFSLYALKFQSHHTDILFPNFFCLLGQKYCIKNIALFVFFCSFVKL